MRVVLSVITALLLTGCQAPGPEKVLEARTVEVRIPVPTPCIKLGQIPAAPTRYADEDLPRGSEDGPDRYRLITQANAQRRERLAMVEPAIEACR